MDAVPVDLDADPSVGEGPVEFVGAPRCDCHQHVMAGSEASADENLTDSMFGGRVGRHLAERTFGETARQAARTDQLRETLDGGMEPIQGREPIRQPVLGDT